MFEDPRRGREARNFTTNFPKILDLKSSSEQIFSGFWRWVPTRIVEKRIWQSNLKFDPSPVLRFLILPYFFALIPDSILIHLVTNLRWVQREVVTLLTILNIQWDMEPALLGILFFAGDNSGGVRGISDLVWELLTPVYNVLQLLIKL